MEASDAITTTDSVDPVDAAHAGRGTLVIACGARAREIAALRRANGWSERAVRCLPAELHNRPERIAPAVRAAIRENRSRYTTIFVASGDCGTGGPGAAL